MLLKIFDLNFIEIANLEITLKHGNRKITLKLDFKF